MRRLLVVFCTCMMVPAAVALAAVNGTFAGKTSAGGKVTIHVTDDVIPKHPQSVFHYKAKCTSGTLTGATYIDGKLRSGNSFAVVNAKDSVPVGKGLLAHHTVTVRFTIKGRTAKGTFSNSATITRGAKTIDHCRTGKLTFKATK